LTESEKKGQKDKRKEKKERKDRKTTRKAAKGMRHSANWATEISMMRSDIAHREKMGGTASAGHPKKAGD
jgi:hypothetical protein